MHPEDHPKLTRVEDRSSINLKRDQEMVELINTKTVVSRRGKIRSSAFDTRCNLVRSGGRDVKS